MFGVRNQMELSEQLTLQGATALELIIYLMSEDKSSSPEQKGNKTPSHKSASLDKDQRNKVFITNLDSKIRENVLQDELRKHCAQFGPIESLVVKRSPHSDYSFAFLNYEKEESGVEAVKELGDLEIFGRKIRIQFQSDTRRRKDRNEGCYICHKFGHFARECHEKREYTQRRSRDRKRRSRSRSRDDRRRRRRSRSHKRQKKYRSRDRSNDSRPRYRRDRSRSRKRSDSSR